jgi:tetratricopeptide (TPR) repeat protein
MSKAKVTATADKSGGAESSTYPKGATRSGRINVQMVQNVLLIWLDSNIDDSSSDCRNTISQLRRAVNTINTFIDGEQCVQFLETMEKEKACMIISGALGQQIVPRVHSMSQVDSIFIFCSNRKYHEQWTKDWWKIKGVFAEIKPICEALKKAAQQCEQSAISISIMNTDGDTSKKNLDQLDPSFMYTQIMQEILLTIKFEQQHIDEFIRHCREVLAENEGELKNVDQLERTYRKHTPIWWYTYECFLYPMLNRALRLMDVDLIIKLGFFIGDLHRQLEQLHQEQFGDQSSKQHLTVYRGQGMAKGDFEKMTTTKGGLLSFNCFLSTSKDDKVSLDFAQRGATNPDMVGVLFVMTIDSAGSSTPFASIVDVGFFGDQEEEVLFSMNTVFRIGNITPMGDKHRLFRVELTLTSDKDNDLRQLTDRIREETFPNQEGWSRLGNVLGKMGQSEKAQQVYETLLEQATEEKFKAIIYHQLALFKQDLGKYPEAITYYDKSIKIEEKQIPRDDQNLAMSYNNMGNVYYSMGDYSKALSTHEKALAIRQQLFSSNHPHLGMSYNNIGNVHTSMGDYSKALSSYEKTLAILQQSLPLNHPDFGSAYDNIGLVHQMMGNYSKAGLFYERAVDVAQRSLPSNHPSLQKWSKHLADIKKNLL